jgi:antitoxin component of RelBE/YafQ-DinJ toxin-antitoxin module
MKTQVTITMDKDVKKDLQAFAKEIGVNMSTLLNLSARKLTYTRHLDFDFSTFMTDENIKARKKAIDDLATKKNIIPLNEL